MANFWHELSLLDKRLEDQKLSAQIVKLELDENEEVHYSGQGQKYIIGIDGMEERLANGLMNSVENSKLHTDVLTEEEELEQHTELSPMEEKAWKPYYFYFNNCFMIIGLVAYSRVNLAQVTNQIKMKEGDFVEVLYPWKRDVQLLKRMMDSQDSIQKEIIVKEGKDGREEIKISKE